MASSLTFRTPGAMDLCPSVWLLQGIWTFKLMAGAFIHWAFSSVKVVLILNYNYSQKRLNKTTDMDSEEEHEVLVLSAALAP